ncbi:hypothetical protein XELAEV_18001366mg [Xenopus laevis]|nr:hypothetical protein XELAEV_18001366mg [Xenopus laevis]
MYKTQETQMSVYKAQLAGSQTKLPGLTSVLSHITIRAQQQCLKLSHRYQSPVHGQPNLIVSAQTLPLTHLFLLPRGRRAVLPGDMQETAEPTRSLIKRGRSEIQTVTYSQ